MLQLLKIAPLALSGDMFVAIGFCYAPIIVWLYLAFRASRSGSIVKKATWYRGGFKFESSTENIKWWQSAWVFFAALWLVLGSLFFWIMLWPDHHDVWFIQ